MNGAFPFLSLRAQRSNPAIFWIATTPLEPRNDDCLNERRPLRAALSCHLLETS
jgi:hypothetical protein